MLKLAFLVSLIFSPAHGKPSRSVSPFIVSGSDAAAAQFPYHFSLQYLSPTQGWGHICGGILFNDRYGLTAAHCVQNMLVTNLRVFAGSLDRMNDDGAGQLLAIQSFIQHPNYTMTAGIPNDIAILTFTGPADTSGPNVQNAILPEDNSNDFTASQCFVSGWGATVPGSNQLSPTLQFTQIPTINNTYCESLLSGIDNAVPFDSSLCSYSVPTLDTGACNGDAGGPVSCYPSAIDTSVLLAAGLMSYIVTTQGNCDTRYPTVSLRLGYYYPWISENSPFP